VTLAVAAESLWPGRWPCIRRLLGGPWALGEGDGEDDFDEDGEDEDENQISRRNLKRMRTQQRSRQRRSRRRYYGCNRRSDRCDRCNGWRPVFLEELPCVIAIMALVMVDFLTISFDSRMWTGLYWMVSSAVGFQLAFMAFTFNHGTLH